MRSSIIIEDGDIAASIVIDDRELSRIQSSAWPEFLRKLTIKLWQVKLARAIEHIKNENKDAIISYLLDMHRDQIDKESQECIKDMKDHVKLLAG